MDAFAVDLYLGGVGTTELASRYGVHRTTIQRYLKSKGVELRFTPYTDYNHGFFGTYTIASAYWAGFIMADGCVKSDRNTLEIGLAKKDKGHLEKFYDAIGLHRDVKTYGNASYAVVSGKQIIEDLRMRYGIIPRKSLVAQYPYDLPDSMRNHFIRGVFDGDGSIASNKNSIVINFTGSIWVLHGIMVTLHDAANIRVKNDTEMPSGQLYSPSVGIAAYSGNNAKLALEWMYSESTSAIRLDRKYERWKNYKEEHVGDLCPRCR